MLRAKRAIEAMLEKGETIIRVTAVEDLATLARELHRHGVKVRKIAEAPVDVQALRLSLDLTQDQFALRYGLDPDAVKNWEQGRRKPDRAVQSYLRVIARQPQAAAQAQEEPV